MTAPLKNSSSNSRCRYAGFTPTSYRAAPVGAEVGWYDALAHVYESGGYDLDLNYQKEPVPPLTGEAAAWAKEIVANYRQPS